MIFEIPVFPIVNPQRRDPRFYLRVYFLIGKIYIHIFSLAAASESSEFVAEPESNG
jgi:hypothetical protein